MTSDNKIYGYDSMPYDPPRNVDADKKIYIFQRGGVIEVALQHTAAHCNTLQHTATHCNTLQHTATPFNMP